MTNTKPNTPNVPEAVDNGRKLRAGASKLIATITPILQATTLGLLGLGFGNLSGVSTSLDTGLAVLLSFFGILTLMLACGIQFLDPTNGEET